MKNIYLLLLSLFLLPSAFAKDGYLFNPCGNESVLINEWMSNKSILLNKKTSLGDGEDFLISYLDANRDICLQKNMIYSLN